MHDPSISASKLLNGDRVYRYDLYDPPFYILSRYNDISYALREPDIFIESHGNGPNFINSNGVLSDGRTPYADKKNCTAKFSNGFNSKIRRKTYRNC